MQADGIVEHLASSVHADHIVGIAADDVEVYPAVVRYDEWSYVEAMCCHG